MINKKSLKKESKKLTGILAGISFISGFLFLDKNITGNSIIDPTKAFYSESISIIGLLLIICSVILTYYALKK